MSRWRFTRHYRSSYGTGALGDEAEFEDAVAEAINRDSPGCLVPVIEAPAPRTATPKSVSTRQSKATDA